MTNKKNLDISLTSIAVVVMVIGMICNSLCWWKIELEISGVDINGVEINVAERTESRFGYQHWFNDKAARKKTSYAEIIEAMDNMMAIQPFIRREKWKTVRTHFTTAPRLVLGLNIVGIVLLTLSVGLSLMSKKPNFKFMIVGMKILAGCLLIFASVQYYSRDSYKAAPEFMLPFGTKYRITPGATIILGVFAGIFALVSTIPTYTRKYSNPVHGIGGAPMPDQTSTAGNV